MNPTFLRYCPLFLVVVAVSLTEWAPLRGTSGGEVLAATITLAWDASPDPDVSGYRIYARASGSLYQYANPVCETTDTRCGIEIFENRTPYYFIVRAINTQGAESTDSNEVVYWSKNHMAEVNGAEEMPAFLLPTGPAAFFYDPSPATHVENSSELFRPLEFVDLHPGILSVLLHVPPFENAVDIYVGIYAPEINPSVYLVGYNRSLTPLYAGVESFVSNKLGDMAFPLFENIPISQLRPGIYYLSVLVTPANEMGDYYLWTTYLTIP